ncbi:hypothetical protein M2164_008426 [Streptomyces sp. SAI-208]|nr:hypothetical protein [Streptomyces sp. SAI-208]
MTSALAAVEAALFPPSEPTPPVERECPVKLTLTLTRIAVDAARLHQPVGLGSAVRRSAP